MKPMAYRWTSYCLLHSGQTPSLALTDHLGLKVVNTQGPPTS